MLDALRRLRRGASRLPLGAPLLVGALLLAAGCEEPDPELVPDEVLQGELGLTEEDRVHTVRISTGTQERAEPSSLTVLPGDYVQFVSGDRLVHEVRFRIDSLSAPARTFLTRTGQGASPPLLEMDARFVVSFVGAPVGRYPYGLEGNRGAGSGEIVVKAESR